jgi:DNA-3-methyladenine glycosylase II
MNGDTIATHNPVIGDHIRSYIDKDSQFSRYFESVDQVDREIGQDGMAGLIKIILGQQVSTAAADSMWNKFIHHFDPKHPGPILKANDDTLKTCGFSRQKIGYLRGLAHAVNEGDLNIESWKDKDSQTVINEITALKGFGLWSAQMFLIFNLARHDVWPHGDLGIQIGLQTYLGEDTRPTEKETKDKAYLFEGMETAAALLLWRIKDNL